MIQWQVDVNSNSEPIEEKLTPSPEFAKGDWVLDVEARGIGEETFGIIHDNFNIQLTITHRCIQFPMEESCSSV